MKTLTMYISLIAIYFVYLSTFITVSIQKWKSGLPDWFANQFKNTFIAKLPGGVAAGFWSITILETAVAISFLIALFTGEWSFEQPLVWMQFGTALAALTFGALGFGLRISGDFQGAANLFIYFTASLIVIIFLHMNPFIGI